MRRQRSTYSATGYRATHLHCKVCGEAANRDRDSGLLLVWRAHGLLNFLNVTRRDPAVIIIILFLFVLLLFILAVITPRLKDAACGDGITIRNLQVEQCATLRQSHSWWCKPTAEH